MARKPRQWELEQIKQMIAESEKQIVDLWRTLRDSCWHPKKYWKRQTYSDFVDDYCGRDPSHTITIKCILCDKRLAQKSGISHPPRSKKIGSPVTEEDWKELEGKIKK